MAAQLHAWQRGHANSNSAPWENGTAHDKDRRFHLVLLLKMPMGGPKKARLGEEHGQKSTSSMYQVRSQRWSLPRPWVKFKCGLLTASLFAMFGVLHINWSHSCLLTVSTDSSPITFLFKVHEVISDICVLSFHIGSETKPSYSNHIQVHSEGPWGHQRAVQ